MKYAESKVKNHVSSLCILDFLKSSNCYQVWAEWNVLTKLTWSTSRIFCSKFLKISLKYVVAQGIVFYATSHITLYLFSAILDLRVECTVDNLSPISSVVHCYQCCFYIHICSLSDTVFGHPLFLIPGKVPGMISSSRQPCLTTGPKSATSYSLYLLT